jgi:hypothetical protein
MYSFCIGATLAQADRRVQHSEGRAMAEELNMLFFEARQGFVGY